MMEYTREQLIKLCEMSAVQQSLWLDRDSASAQKQIGECWALLNCGCDFEILKGKDRLSDNNEIIWVEIEFDGFQYFEIGKKEKETFYIPTHAKLEKAMNEDWY